MFDHRNGQLYCDELSLAEFAGSVPTPFYLYAKKTMLERIRTLSSVFSSLPSTVIAYAVKTNNNLSILKIAAGEGLGADIISRGELFRYLAAGGDARKVVFSGVAKTEAELRYAMERNILMINAESLPELLAIDRIAADYGTVNVALRINPDVAAGTHKKITTGTKGNKFGVGIETIRENIALLRSLKHAKLTGIAMHIGSQILKAKPYHDSYVRAKAVLELLRSEGFTITHVDIGGGFGIPYNEAKDEPFDFTSYKKTVIPVLEGFDATMIVEPGRFIVAESGVLVARVEYVKVEAGRTFVIVNAGMNDLVRVAMYDAYHEILPLVKRAGTMTADIVGPVCESSDVFASGRRISTVKEGDCVAIMNAGAYGYSMSSNYNGRPRLAEYLVDGSHVRPIRREERLEEMITHEKEYLQ
ncbi:MAG: diaminopimelate decarboxylase [Spirochaetota bacterium]